VAIDPALGGGLTTPDGALSVQVPPGAAADVLTLSLVPVDPAVSAANLQVGAQYYALSVADSAGDAVMSFDQPITLLVAPPPDQDPASVPIAALDPATGALTALPAVVQSDGTLAAEFTGLGPPTTVADSRPTE
jgi:hypothetical protein